MARTAPRKAPSVRPARNGTALRAGHHSQALDLLLAYEADAAIIGWNVSRPGLSATTLFDDPIMLVGPAGARLPDRCTMAEVAREALLVLPAESGLRKEVARAFELVAQPVPRHTEYPTLETLKSAIQMGMGRALIPQSAVRSEMISGLLEARAVVDWPSPTRQVRLVVRSEGPVPEGVREFARLLREHWVSERRS